ncbi:hypothetical protein ACFWJM_01690 [Streptomyces sp. NPDC127077]|uniref:hypothetical protein n=1 Tax=Streptomyces sp. NPDC127077 TaxID=3347131 RepID=UPI00365B9301
MGIPPILNVCRHDTDNRAPDTLTGEIDLQSVPSAHTPAERYPHEAIHTIDVDALADRPDQPVLAAPRRWDRTDVGDGRRAADGAVLLAPVLPLGVRTAARLPGLDHLSWTRWLP